MSLDRFCQYLIVGLLPLLWLPTPELKWAIGVGLGATMLGACRRQPLLLLLGLLWAVSYWQVLEAVRQTDQVTASQTLERITIRQILKQHDYQTAIAERLQGKEGESQGRIYLTWQSSTPLELNRTYLAELHLRPISARLNEGNFNRQRWYFAQNIHATATVKRAEMQGEPNGELRSAWLQRVRQQTQSLSQQGLLLALAFGERAWLLPQTWQIFQQTTTAHLIAISGLHIGLAFAFGIVLAKGLQWICLRFSVLQAVGFSLYFVKTVGFLFALGYSFLAGFSVPTLRALLAISVVLACRLARRHYTPWQFFWRVVALLLVFDPFSLLSDSFWLSVLAVASLICWYQLFPLSRWLAFISPKPTFTSKIYRGLLSLLHLQFGIWLLFTPVQLYFFEGSSAFGFVANLLIVPLYSLLIVPLILFSLISDNLIQTWWLANWLAELSLTWLKPMAESWIDVSQAVQKSWIVANLTLLGVLYGGLNKASRGYWLAAGSLFSGLLGLFLLPTLQPKPQVSWLHFDVGQGLAMVFIYHKNGQPKAVLYDSGASWAGGSMAELEIIPYLKRQGVNVETLFISHDDNDHAGGTTPLLAAFPTKLVLSGQNRYDAPAEPCYAGQRWQFGGLTLQALFPRQTLPAKQKAENADSCVLLAEIGAFRLLLTGDSGVAQERQFAAKVGKVDFLQVGHHGSKTSSSETLLAAIRPDWAIISASRWNRWGLPDDEVIARLKRHQARLLNTAESGMIRVDFYTDHYRIHTQRDRWQPWYHGYFGR